MVFEVAIRMQNFLDIVVQRVGYFIRFFTLGERCGDRGSTVVQVLRYKSESRGFDPRWFHWNFSLT
jgi:hypothetical protein